MVTRRYDDPRTLRRRVEELVDAEPPRVRVTRHAREAHPEFSDLDRIAIVRWGGQDQPDRDRPSSDGVYLCWANHPTFGRCRACYAIEETTTGDILVIVSVFPE